MLVSGESLLNDGTAIVIFALMLKVVLGAYPGPAEVASFFGHMLFSSALLGGMVGGLAVLVIGKCAEQHYQSDAMIQTAITICCGYLAFFLGESEVATSGVITTVCAGFVLAHSAWPRFVSRETMHIVWETIEFIGNTLIFFLAGVIFGDIVLSRMSYIRPSDFGYLLLLYILVTLIRTSMILVFWIPLNLAGTPLTAKEGLVMVWSGLRGAVSLCLAIIVDLEPGISAERGTRIMFHVGGIAALTFLINATTAASLLRWLGLTKPTQAKLRMLSQFDQHLAEHATKAFEAEQQGSHDARFSGASRAIVHAMVPSLRLASPSLMPARQLAESPQDSGLELAKVYREAYLQVIRKYYWDAIEEGVLPRNTSVATVLLHSVDEALDSINDGFSDWEAIRSCSDMQPPGFFTRLMGGLSSGTLGWLIPYLRRVFLEENRAGRRVVMALTFQQAHRRAQEEVPHHFGHDDELDAQVQEQVAMESEEQCRASAKLLERTPPQVVELGKSEMLARKLLNMQLVEIAEMRESGLLTSPEASILERKVNFALRRIVSSPKDAWSSLWRVIGDPDQPQWSD